MRVAIANDLPLAVEALRRVVSSARDYSVAWVAHDGEETVRRCISDRPDVLLLDLDMPSLDGVEATRRIMAQSPCAIVVVTSAVEASFDKVYEAMALGALDAIDTPRLGIEGGVAGAATLLAKLALVSKLVGRTPAPAWSPEVTGAPVGASPREAPLVAIGASTGGPSAVVDVLAALGRGFPAPVVIVQHVDLAFAPGLARWLTTQSGFPVELVALGEKPRPGVALLAATRDHLVVGEDRALAYTARPRETPYRPSVDVFYHSLAAYWPRPGIAVLLTGMGRDGAEGLLRLRKKGWHTIAQDERTSVVYGMPKAAADRGAAARVMPVTDIGPAIRERVLAARSAP